MSQRSLEDRLAKLQQLKKRKHEGEKQNRQELFKEHKDKAVDAAKLKAIQQKQEKAMEELDNIEAEERGEDWKRKKGWDYSIEDHEKWDKKVAAKNSNKKNSGFVNYSQLAEQSYNKEVENLEIDKETYQEQKNKLNRKKIRSGEDDEDNEIQHEQNDAVDYSNKPSKQSIDRLVNNLKGSDSRKMRRRKDYDSTDTYINDKNKQFNEKLDRHYDKFKK